MLYLQAEQARMGRSASQGEVHACQWAAENRLI